MGTPSSKRPKYSNAPTSPENNPFLKYYDYSKPVINSNASTPVISPAQNPFSKYRDYSKLVINSNASTPVISPAQNNNETPVVSHEEYLQERLREINNIVDNKSNNLLGDLNRESNKRKREGGRKRSTTQKRKQNNKKKSKKTKKTNTKPYWK